VAAGSQAAAAAAPAASMTALTYTLPLLLCPDWQDVTPAPNSVIDLLLRAKNKETGQGLTDVQIAAQCNTIIAGKAARGGAPQGTALPKGTAQDSTQGLLVTPPCHDLPLLPGRACSRLRDVCQRAVICHLLPGHPPRSRGSTAGRDRRVWRRQGARSCCRARAACPFGIQGCRFSKPSSLLHELAVPLPL
jgi:hypothetical protein